MKRTAISAAALSMLLLFGFALAPCAGALGSAPECDNLELCTRRNIPVEGRLSARDPDGDKLTWRWALLSDTDNYGVVGASLPMPEGWEEAIVEGQGTPRVTVRESVSTTRSPTVYSLVLLPVYFLAITLTTARSSSKLKGLVR